MSRPCLHCAARYYALADATLPAGREPSDRAWLPPVLDDARGIAAVDVQGITCAACVWVIEKLGDRRGVACHVNPGVGRLEVDAGSDHAALGAFFAA